MYQIGFRGKLSSQRACRARVVHLFLFRLLQPLTSDLLATSQCDRHTFEQLMSDHCFTLSVSTNFYQMWSQQFTRIVVRQLVSRRSHVWQHNSQEHRQLGEKKNTQGVWPRFAVSCFPLLFHCFLLSRGKRSDGRGYGNCSSPAQCLLSPSLRCCWIRWSWLPLLGSDLRRPVSSCTQELESCSASF